VYRKAIKGERDTFYRFQSHSFRELGGYPLKIQQRTQSLYKDSHRGFEKYFRKTKKTK
jgi:hypothetical protein